MISISIYVSSTLWKHHMGADEAYRKKKAWRELHKNVTSFIEQILEATSHKTAATSHL